MTTEYRVVSVEVLKVCLRLANLQGPTFHRKQLIDLIAAPMPPADREPEVLACIYHGEPGEVALVWRHVPVGRYVLKFELVDRAHVTRLQAEVGRLTIAAKYSEDVDAIPETQLEMVAYDLAVERDTLKAEVEQVNTLLRTHAQVIRDQEQLIQNQRLVNEKLEIEVKNLHAVIQRLNGTRRRVPTDVSRGVLDKSAAVTVADLQSELTKARELITQYQCKHEWIDNGEDLLVCPKCGKEDSDSEPFGWVQTSGPSINRFTQEWDVVEEWSDSGYEWVELFSSQDHQSAPVAKCKTCDGTGIEYDGAGHACTACNGAPAAKPVLVECDACPTSGGCVNACMKAPAAKDDKS